MSHFTRPVKQDTALVVAYPDLGSAVIHAAGCSHAKGSRTVRESLPFSYEDSLAYNDDWYDVAPCAADGKGRVCTEYGDNCNC